MIKHLPKVLVSSLLLTIGFSGMAQLQPNSSFCTLGLQPDGFVDWFKLPTPPASGGVKAAIPVTGIPGLTATLQISNPTPGFTPGGPQSYYQVGNAATLSLPLNTNPTIMFSKPVKGVSVTFQAGGRFGYNFQMTAYNNAGQMTSVGPPPPANVDLAEMRWVPTSLIRFHSKSEA